MKVKTKKDIRFFEKSIVVRVRKESMEQFVYIPLTKYNIEPGTSVTVEFWCNKKLIRRGRYTVLEKTVGKKTYRFIWVRLPYFTVIRDVIKSKWRPYFDLEIKVKLGKLSKKGS